MRTKHNLYLNFILIKKYVLVKLFVFMPLIFFLSCFEGLQPPEACMKIVFLCVLFCFFPAVEGRKESAELVYFYKVKSGKAGTAVFSSPFCLSI